MDYPISVPSVGLVGGKFVDEDPLVGTPGSLIPAQWGNAVTEEILNVVGAAGLAPDEDNNAQLLAAIRFLGKVPVLLTDTGAANAYAAVNSPAMSVLPASGYVQKVKITNANTGASTYAPDGLAAKPIYGLGLQPLQGGELPAGVAIMMYLVQAGVNGGNGAWILIESLGGASQVAPATKSQHAVQRAQLGSYNAMGFSSVNTTWTAANLGQVVFVLVAGTTQTLPAAASSPSGTTMTFSAYATTTLKGNGAELITNIFGTAATNTIPLGAGEQIQLTSNGVGWYISAYDRAEAGAVISSASNLKMTVNVASALATVTADEVVVGTALGGTSLGGVTASYRLSSFNKSINLAATGAGGMDTGVAPVSGFVAIYAIFNPGTGASALLAVNATAGIAPPVYGGANMPAGYTASALLTVVPTNASSQFKIFVVRGRAVGVVSVLVYATSVAVTGAAVSLASVAPPNAVEVSGTCVLSANTAANLGLAISSDTNLVSQQNMSLSNMSAGQSLIQNYSGILVSTPQQITVTSVVTSGVPSISLNVTEYRI